MPDASRARNEGIVVINLDRSVDRLRRFRWNNRHVPNLQRFAALDGRRLDRDRCIRDGLVTAANPYTMPALGCSLSHVALWRRCAAGDGPLTICEDDAILHRHFLAGRSRILSGLRPDWDIVQWGWNLDWPMLIELAPGMPPAIVKFPDADPRPDFAAFESAILRPQVFPLHSSAGAACYTLSVAGAQRLLERCLPLGGEHAAWAENPVRHWENTAVDVEMARHYSMLRAFVAVPPLAISPNEHAQSTVWSGAA
jgi:GR25 family glycosyltransferase involved in LPS biosynthesis